MCPTLSDPTHLHHCVSELRIPATLSNHLVSSGTDNPLAGSESLSSNPFINNINTA